MIIKCYYTYGTALDKSVLMNNNVIIYIYLLTLRHYGINTYVTIENL